MILVLLGILSCQGYAAPVSTLKTFVADKQATRVHLYKRTKNFIDIEAPIAQVWFGCDPTQGDRSYLAFYVLDGQGVQEFHYRRVLGVSQCLTEAREYRRMAKGAKVIRIVGIHPIEEQEGEPQAPPSKHVPARFASVKKMTAWIFQRFQVGNKCKSFFEEDCDLPKRYWTSIIPQ